jgi:NarL family two-component system response regulator LiaR
LTSFAEKTLIEEAIQAGATSYIVKNSSSEELAAAIRIAQSGQTTISRVAIQSLVQTETSDSKRLGDDLTSREREVLALMVIGLSNAEIGRRLVIQPATVNFHVGNILSKLEVSNRTEAASVAVQLELIR